MKFNQRTADRGTEVRVEYWNAIWDGAPGGEPYRQRMEALRGMGYNVRSIYLGAGQEAIMYSKSLEHVEETRDWFTIAATR